MGALAEWLVRLTSLVFAKLYWLFQLEIVCVHLGIETVERLQDYSQTSGADINGAPRGDCLDGVHFWLNILKVPLGKLLDRLALWLAVSNSFGW